MDMNSRYLMLFKSTFIVSLVLFFNTLLTQALAQEESLDFCDYYSSQNFGKQHINGVFSWENDAIGSDSDKWYTNGMQYRLTDNPICNKPGILDKSVIKFARLINLVDGYSENGPFYTTNTVTSYGSIYGMNMYTPEDIEIVGPQENDRPWSGWLHFGSFVDEKKYNSEGYVQSQVTLDFKLGVLGEWANQDRVQKGWHKITGSADPLGWDNQKDGELGVNLNIDYASTITTGEFNGKPWSVFWNAGGSIGNVKTMIKSGIGIQWATKLHSIPQIGNIQPKAIGYVPLPYGEKSFNQYTSMEDNRHLVFPKSVGDSGRSQSAIHQELEKMTKQRKEWFSASEWGVSFGVELKYVHDNYFLEGTDIEIIPGVVDANFGIWKKWKGSNLTTHFTLMRTSAEFEDSFGVEANPHTYGRFTFEWAWEPFFLQAPSK